MSSVQPDPKALAWIKASRSLGNSGCLEVAPHGGGVAVRDSKDQGGPILLYTAHEWKCFLDGVKKGEFDQLVD